MRLVVQHDDKDGGVACIAMLVGLPYVTVRRAAPAAWFSGYTSFNEIRAELARYGVTASHYQMIGGKNFRTFDFDAILRGRSAGHERFAVWDGRRRLLLDPGLPKSAFECTSFIRILPRK